MNTSNTYYIYILNCENNTYYTGYTVDMNRRYSEHVLGTDKCKYTRSFKPLSIAQCWQVIGDKALAMRIERYIKKLTKLEKKELILHPERLCEQYPSMRTE